MSGIRFIDEHPAELPRLIDEYLTNDFAEEVGLDLPELEPATLKKVGEVLPAYGNYGNPLDVTAGFAPDALSVAAKALLDDPNTGMLFISFRSTLPTRSRASTREWLDRPSPK
jgi:acyl-CoA synthetase (NDP forming)